MKRHILFHILVITTVLHNKSFAQTESHRDTTEKTIKILTRDPSNELAGSAYTKRAIGFYVLSDNDTSKFLCILDELLTGAVLMKLRWSKTKTFSEQFSELKKILTEAKKEFDFDSLKYIDAGLLLETGELALKVNKEILALSQNNYTITERQAEKYLMKTQVAREFNALLRPFNLTVAAFEIEHAYFTEKRFVFKSASGGSKVTTPANKIPDKLFDCDLTIRVKKI